jgi:hypothetical protein
MRLIEIKDEMPVFNPETRMIKEFKRIIERDRGSKGDHDGRKKFHATKELAFIYFYCVYDSRFDQWDGEEKVDKIKEYLDLPDKWKIDDDIQAGIDRYKDMMWTRSLSLFLKMSEGARKLEVFIDEIDLDERTKNGGLVFSPDKLRTMIEKMPSTIKALNEAQDMIKKDQESKLSKKGEALSIIDKEGAEDTISDGF